MDIYINLSNGQLVQSASNRQVVTSLRFKRGDSSKIRVFFVNGTSTTLVSLPNGTTGKFGLKESGDYDGGFVVSDTDWTYDNSDPDAPHYVFEPNFNTTQLNDLLGIGAAPDKESVTLMGEIEWVTAGAISSSVTFKAVVDNDVIRGNEGVPTDADPPYPLPGEIELIAHKGVANGYAALDASGKVPAAQLPALALTATLSVADQAARLALTSAQASGKIVVQADNGTSWGLIAGGNPANAGDWIQVGDRDIVIGDVSGLQAALDGKQAASANLDAWSGKTAPTGDVVGTTDTQTLENKTLESPTINGGATISGNTTIDGDATISGDATIDGIVTLTTANINYNLNVNDILTANSILEVNGDAHFNGPNNTAPNQTAASASSLMTRELSDARYLSFANLRVIQSNTVSVANSGAGSSASGNNLQYYATGNPGTADNGYARITVARGLNNIPSFSGSGIRFFLPIGGAFLINAGCYPTSSEKSFRIIFGGNAGVPAPADSDALSTLGFGMEIKYESGSPKWRLFAHNGTTYTTSPSWQTFPGNPSGLGDHVACVIESNGAGTISARVGYGYGPNADLQNAAVHSITGGPTGWGSLNNSYVDLVAVNPSTGGPHYQHSSFTIISRPQFYI
jgi:hypothetical protein